MSSQEETTPLPNRLGEGGHVPVGETVSFYFDDRRYRGHAGESLAAALLANGVHLVGRSFKYHRPRGIMTAGPEEPNALVQIGRDPARTEANCKATEIEIYEGLEAFSQNCWPSLRLDIGALGDALSPLLPAGFYYKTLMRPQALWPFYEKHLRRAAGMGKSPTRPDPESYEHLNQHCEVLVVGGGPAGLMAARAAARTGARVILAEDRPHLGGGLLALAEGAARIGEQSPQAWLAEIRGELEAAGNVEILTRTTAQAYHHHNLVLLWERCQDHVAPGLRPAEMPRQRLRRVRARQVVLATGAIERALVFPGNDRPGIMLAGAVSRYVNGYGVLPGRRALVVTNHDGAYRAALDLHQAGARVAALIDLRDGPDGPLVEQARRAGLPVIDNATVIGTRGRKHITGADVARMEDGEVTGESRLYDCNLLVMSGGWNPNVALFSQSRGKLRWDAELSAFCPGRSFQAERSAGAGNGSLGLAQALAEGAAAGTEAARAAGFKTRKSAPPQAEGPDPGVPMPVWRCPTDRPPHKVRAFVDFQNDVAAKDLDLAMRENYRSVEHVKRYTVTGLGTDQGRISNMNAFGIIADNRGEAVPEIGVTTFRPPYKPVSFGAMAGQHRGELFAPKRTTPMHGWHMKNGAWFEPVGEWLRAWVYPRPGESFEDALMRECRAAREACGVLDYSTLGKIDIQGPDAREFLNRVYTNAWTKLKPGRCRYGLMCGEDGMVMDDGVSACIADDHFHMTTTTGGAARVLAHLEDYLQTEWPDLEVYLTSTTEQWAVASICGPNSGKLLAELVDDIKVDPGHFPFMSWRDAHIEGVPVRIFRVSFTGELSYEVNIPASYGLWLWEKMMAAGAPHGATPYGTEAMHLLRAEKGLIIVGQDTDGTVTPQDLRMSWAVSGKKDFIGARSLATPDLARADRKQLVGLLTRDPELVLDEGAQVIDYDAEPSPPVPMLGHVTSSYYSPNLGRSIAMGMVTAGETRMGEILHVSRKDAPPAPVEVTNTVFFDKEGARRDG